MHYKTMVLGLLEQHPSLYQQLHTSRTLLPMLDRYATALQACHVSWMNQLVQTRPDSQPCQISSEALELALQEFQESLPPASSPSDSIMEPLSLDAAMAFLNRHTSPE
jgi:hypothetical protein